MKKDTDGLDSKKLRHHALKLTMLSAVTLGIMLSLTGCNTMHGIGKDVEKAGEAIQRSTN